MDFEQEKVADDDEELSGWTRNWRIQITLNQICKGSIEARD